MQTRDKILLTALELYNNQGISSITSRHIAAKMSISAGNLHYHFKHTEDIIRTLYKELAGEFEKLLSWLGNEDITGIEWLNSSWEEAFKLICKYRFVFLHIVEITERIPDIKALNLEIRRKREEQFIVICKKLIENGTLREDIPEHVWSALVTQMFMITDFWLSHKQLYGETVGEQALADFKQLMASVFYPYLANP